MKRKITIGHFPIIDHLVLGIAAHNDAGSFEHFDLKTKIFRNWEVMQKELRAGSIDGAFMLFPLAMEVFREGTDIRLVLLGQREGQVLILENGIKSVADLKGKTIFIPHRFSVHNILMHQLLKREGIDPDRDVHYKVGFEDVGELAGAVASGAVQAAITAEPWGTLAREKGQVKILPVSHDLKMHHVCCVLVLRNELIREDPASCQELVESLVKAGMFVSAYPRQAAEIGEKFLDCPKNILLESLTHDRGHVLMWDLLPRLEDFTDLQDIAIKEMKLWDTPLDLTRFIEPRFAQEAYREWMMDARREAKDKGAARSLPGTMREGVARIAAEMKKEIRYTALRFIGTGEKYPADLVRRPGRMEAREMERGMKGDEFCLELSGNDHKAVCFVRDGECDRIVLDLSPEEAARVYNALRFGIQNTASRIPTPALDDIFRQGEIMIPHGDRIWYVLDHTVFKFLSLLLNYY